MALTKDLIRGHSLSEGPDGYELKRVFLVTEVEGTPEAKIINALRSVGVIRGDFHPADGTIQADVIDVKPADSDGSTSQFFVTITYRRIQLNFAPPDEAVLPQLTVGSTVQSTKTNFDAFGETMFTEYNEVDVDDDGLETRRIVATKQKAEVEVQVPQTVIRLSRKENQPPFEKSKTFVGTINATTFAGDPAHYWLCTRIEGTSSDGGKTYQVEYEFQRNTDTWNAVVTFRDENNDIPTDILNFEGTAIKEYQVYPEIDFGSLRLF